MTAQDDEYIAKLAAATDAAAEALIAFEERHGIDLDPATWDELGKIRVSIFDVPRALAEAEARLFPPAAASVA